MAGAGDCGGAGYGVPDLWQYGRLQSKEERTAWEIEMNHLQAMGRKILPKAEDVFYEDGRVLRRTVEYLLIARRSDNVTDKKVARIVSPRLVNRKQAADFKIEVVEDPPKLDLGAVDI